MESKLNINLNLLEKGDVLKEYLGVDILRPIDICGYGTSRIVYKGKEDSSYIVKFHIDELGYKQSLYEKRIYEEVEERFKELLVKPIYVSDKWSIWEYVKPLLSGVETGNISCRTDCSEIHMYIHEELLDILNDNYGILTEDLDLSQNCGLNNDGKIKYLDYGFKEEWYGCLEKKLEKEELFIPCDLECDVESYYHSRVKELLLNEDKELSDGVIQVFCVTNAIKDKLLKVKSSLITKDSIKDINENYLINYVEDNNEIVAYAIYRRIDKQRVMSDLDDVDVYDEETYEYYKNYIQELNPNTIYLYYVENVSGISGLGSKLVDSIIALKRDILLYSTAEAEEYWQEKGFDNVFGYNYFLNNSAE